jgi:colicin import membrane protein
LDDIFAGLESETSANQQAQGQFVADEVSRYSSIYTQLIQSKLLKDDYLLGKECRVNIKLIPTGADMIVSSVNVLSGDSRVCAAAKSAIAQVPSFPISTDSTVNQRLKDINLTVALQQ